MNKEKVEFVDYIPPRRKELYFRIVDGHAALIHPICLRLHFLEDHMPPAKIDPALKWLIANRITGPRFLEWFKTQCHNSDLEMHAKLLMVVDNAPLAPVVAGKNFKL